MAKITKQYRLSPETLELIKLLQEKIGMSVTATAIVEEAVRRMAEQENVKPLT